MHVSSGVAGTLRANSRGHEPIVYDVQYRRDGARENIGKSNALLGMMGTGGGNVPIIVEDEE